MRRTFSTALLLMLALAALPARAQQDSPSLYDQFQRFAGKDYFNAVVLFRGIGQAQWDRPEGGNGFSVAQARLGIVGRLSSGWSYRAVGDFASSNPLLTFGADYRFNSSFAANAGIFKAPFSQEALRSPAVRDFIPGAQLLRLAPIWQTGAGFQAGVSEAVTFSAGVFNGEGRSLGVNRDNGLLYAARLDLQPQLQEGTLRAGVNGLYEREGSDPALDEDDLDIWSVGGDFRYDTGRFLAAAEVIYSERSPSALDLTDDSFAYQATLGYAPASPTTMFVARWDYLDGYDYRDPAAAVLDRTDGNGLVLLGVNHYPAPFARLSANYVIPAEDAAFENHRLYLLVQISL